MYCVFQTFANNDRWFLDPQELCRTWTPRLKIPTLRKGFLHLFETSQAGALYSLQCTPLVLAKRVVLPPAPLLCLHARVLTLLPSAGGVGRWVGVGGL